MLLLGVVQAQAAGGAAAGSFDLLETQVLTSSAATVTFSSLNTLAAGYQHLQIRLTARTDRGSDAADFLLMQINSTNATKAHTLFADGSSVASSADLFGQKTLGFVAAPAFPTSAYGAAVIDILDPFTGTEKNKTVRSFSALPQSGGAFRAVTLSSAFYQVGSATSITIDCLANFIIGSRFSLYGVRTS